MQVLHLEFDVLKTSDDIYRRKFYCLRETNKIYENELIFASEKRYQEHESFSTKVKIMNILLTAHTIKCSKLKRYNSSEKIF